MVDVVNGFDSKRPARGEIAPESRAKTVKCVSERTVLASRLKMTIGLNIYKCLQHVQVFRRELCVCVGVCYLLVAVVE